MINKEAEKGNEQLQPKEVFFYSYKFPISSKAFRKYVNIFIHVQLCTQAYMHTNTDTHMSSGNVKQPFFYNFLTFFSCDNIMATVQLKTNFPIVLHLECGFLRIVLYYVNIASSSKKIYLVVPLQLLYHLVRFHFYSQ